MSTALQDIMSLITKRKIKVPTDKDYILSAAYTDTQEVLKQQPKMQASLINIGAIKNYILGSIPKVDTGGWARYDDTQYTQAAPLSIVYNASSVILPNNAGFKIETQLNSTNSFYNGILQKVTPGKVNDAYSMVVAFKARTANASRNYMNISMGSANGTPYDRLSKRLFFGKANSWENYNETFLFYTDEDFVANGNQWKISVAGNNDVQIADVIFYIQKTYSGN
jgi:hypothetical protein